ncbi:hypothetical protein WMY93_017000 [Mugilogobius chulae]|uniref:AIG1-type G domain-containing protein n=1 Tax=Mugilogobius chulae TaxID=88201 RepID=A0AAW0NN43_9GOBI
MEVHSGWKNRSGEECDRKHHPGREAFESELSSSSMTSECQKARGCIGDQRIAVIDTPGLFDTNFTEEEIIKRIKGCISLSSPGPHAFVICLQIGRFTKEEKDTVQLIQDTFGEEAAKYTIVLFTHGDKLKKHTIESFIKTNKDLSEFVQMCHNRYHVFNNETEDETQVVELLSKMRQMIDRNGGSFYTHEMFKSAEEAIEKKKQQLLKESEEKRKKEQEQLQAEHAKELARYKENERKIREQYEAQIREQQRRDALENQRRRELEQQLAQYARNQQMYQEQQRILNEQAAAQRRDEERRREERAALEGNRRSNWKNS